MAVPDPTPQGAPEPDAVEGAASVPSAGVESAAVVEPGPAPGVAERIEPPVPFVQGPPDGGQIEVKFGNASPQMQVDVLDEDGKKIGTRSVPAKHLEHSVTAVHLWEGIDDAERVEHTLSTQNDRILGLIARGLRAEHRRFAVAISELEQIVAVHTGGASPRWVTSSDPDLQAALAEHFDCPPGEPTMLLTNGGRDALHAQHMGTSAQPASFNYMALTASTTAPAAGDTTLTGEITTAGGGLVRAQATYAHTAGTNTTTLTKTFTANGSDSLPVTIAQIGVFNASSSGTLGYHTALSATATLNVSGDNLTVTETVTAG